ncbi:MAG: hypothetical protein K1Y36_29840 [Blastocatellia bacterium]|nr:hypothetical protein [Blastocatellia bacterium]
MIFDNFRTVPPGLETPAPVNRKTTCRMYPTPQQEALRLVCQRLHQQLHNSALEERIKAYRMCQVAGSFADNAGR